MKLTKNYLANLLIVFDCVWLCFESFAVCLKVFQCVWKCFSVFDCIWIRLILNKQCLPNCRCFILFNHVWFLFDYIWFCLTMFDFVWLCYPYPIFDCSKHYMILQCKIYMFQFYTKIQQKLKVCLSSNYNIQYQDCVQTCRLTI